MPSDFFNRSIGEQIIIREFFEKELEDRIKEREEQADMLNGRR